jgi:hypothetical protein
VSLALREEHKCEMFENSVSRKIFVPRNNELCKLFRMSNDEELHDLYRSPIIIKG